MLGLDPETIGELSRREIATSEMTRPSSVTAGAITYHLRRQAAGAEDRGARQRCHTEIWAAAIETWLVRRDDLDRLNPAALHAWLVEHHGLPGQPALGAALLVDCSELDVFSAIR